MVHYRRGMKIIIFSSPAVTAQANEWLANNPGIKVLGLAQSEDDGVIHLTMLYEGEEIVSPASRESGSPVQAI
jgi:hypothetical protein